MTVRYVYLSLNQFNAQALCNNVFGIQIFLCVYYISGEAESCPVYVWREGGGGGGVLSGRQTIAEDAHAAKFNRIVGPFFGRENQRKLCSFVC